MSRDLPSLLIKKQSQLSLPSYYILNIYILMPKKSYCQQDYKFYSQSGTKFMRKRKTQTVAASVDKERRKRTPFNQNQVLHIRETDLNYQIICREISQILTLSDFSKHTKIRLQAWLDRLDRAEYSKAWRENRNNYLRLLHLMIHCEVFCSPFSGFPGRGELSILKKHDISQIINEIERAVRLNRTQSRKNSEKHNGLTVCEEFEPLQQIRLADKNMEKLEIDNQNKATSISKQMMSKLRNGSNQMLTKNLECKNINNYKAYTLNQMPSIGDFQTAKPALEESSSQNVVQRLFTCSQRVPTSLSEAINFQQQACLISQKLKRYSDSFKLKPKKIITQKSNTHFQRLSSQNYNIQNGVLGKCNTVKVNDQFNLMLQEARNSDPREYWQSQSIAEMDTPRYLKLYPSHPYVSLALSEQIEENVDSGRSSEKGCINCFYAILPDLWGKSLQQEQV